MTDLRYPRFGVLLVDDEPSWLRALALTLSTNGGLTSLTTCSDSRQVMGLLGSGDFRLVVLDLTMPHVSGEELLALITERHPDTPVIVLSGMNDLNTAVRCMRAGAFDYYVKTDVEERIVSGVLRAVRMIELQDANRELAGRVLSPDLKSPAAFAEVVTRDRAMLSIFSYIESVAGSPYPLCILGESGTGKEMLVRAVHALSGGAGKLVSRNVAGLDETDFADTLFGHIRGAFTGAEVARKGMIEDASGGTLFLDEIGDLSEASQVKLLRLLQEGEYFPLGADEPKRIRARVVVATHQDLPRKEATGQFRRDLFHRLQTHVVTVPPLRSRLGDLELLVEHFAAEAARTLGKQVPGFPKGLLALLERYSFPGNVRELKAMVTDAVSACQGRTLPLAPFVARIQARADATGHSAAAPADGERRNPFAGFESLPTFKQSARFLVEEAMARAGGTQTLAARLLGISQPALNKRLKGMREGDDTP